MECKVGLMYENWSINILEIKGQNPDDHLNTHIKITGQNPLPFHEKNIEQTRSQKELPQPDKEHLGKTHG